jgi:hypothetical protein
MFRYNKVKKLFKRSLAQLDLEINPTMANYREAMLEFRERQEKSARKKAIRILII